MARKDKPKGFTVNRREFLKSAGVVGTVTAAVSPPEVDAQGAASAAALGPGEVPVHLKVNGKRLDLMIEPRVTLLDALRMRADLTGNKRVCDRGACGACTMIVDGRAGLLLLDAGDRGAGQADPHRRRPGERRDAAPGAAGVLRQGRADVRVLHAGLRHGERRRCSRSIRRRRPSRFDEGLDGNICRCGTFSRIFEAVSSVKGVTRG